MFVVTEADAAAIRTVYQQRGEFSAAIELRRRFPGITDNAQARECARTIAGWQPLRPVKRLPKPPRFTAGPLTRAGFRGRHSPDSAARRRPVVAPRTLRFSVPGGGSHGVASRLIGALVRPGIVGDHRGIVPSDGGGSDIAHPPRTHDDGLSLWWKTLSAGRVAP
jgi:hypothetical protein